ncbi:hypothetical protein [Pseudomonas tohonis]|jgi:hypothetical protein|uniref:hypothetical protein n=1 Tax=Pseudomonas tohonis TaxID=2725477 RepID=UPI001F3A3252|nr:hypothetical protein [Pseudomonas tohonis]
MTAGGSVVLTGWLIIIDFKLHLVQVDQAEQVEGCESSQRIEISEPEIIFSVLQRILPLGGGNSFIFHRARVCGVMTSGVQQVVKVISMLVEERGVALFQSLLRAAQCGIGPGIRNLSVKEG